MNRYDCFLGELLKPTQKFKSNLKVYPNFSQMQNQPKEMIKVLFNHCDQPKNINVFYTFVLRKSTLHVIERSLHICICRPPKKPTV